MLVQSAPYPALGRADFSLLARSPNNVHGWQGVAWGGEHWFVTAELTDAEEQWTLLKYDGAFTQVAHRNMGADGDAAHTQIAGLFYHRAEHKLYIGANNYPTTPARGWLFEVDPDDLSVIDYHDLGAKWTEEVWRWGGYWWEVNASGHEIRQFDSSFNLLGTHALPDSDPGALYWQAIFVYDDIFYVNLHASAGGGLRAYEWTGSGFSAVATSLTPPSADCTQGTFHDGQFIYWAERIGIFPPLVGHVVTTSLAERLKVYVRPVLTGRDNQVFKGFTAYGSGGTGPYTFTVQSGSLPAGLSLNASTGLVSGTPTTPGTSSGIVLRVTDSLGATHDSDSFSITIAAELAPWDEIARQATLQDGAIFVNGLDLTGLAAIRIHAVGLTVTTDDSYIAIDFYSGGRVLTGYRWALTDVSSDATTGAHGNESSPNIAISDTSATRMVGNAATESFSAVITVDDPSAATLNKKMGAHAAYIGPDGGGIRTRNVGIIDAGAIDGLVVYGASALTGGKVIVTALN